MLTKLKSKYNLHLEHQSAFWRHDMKVLAGLFNDQHRLIVCRSLDVECWPAFDYCLNISNKLEAEIQGVGDRYYISEDDYVVLDGLAHNEPFYLSGEGFLKADPRFLLEMIQGTIQLKC